MNLSHELHSLCLPCSLRPRAYFQSHVRISGRDRLEFFLQLSPPGARTQERESLLDSGQSARNRRQEIPGGAARPDAVGAQCRGRRRDYVEEGKLASAVSASAACRRREIGNPESLS